MITNIYLAIVLRLCAKINGKNAEKSFFSNSEYVWSENANSNTSIQKNGEKYTKKRYLEFSQKLFT